MDSNSFASPPADCRAVPFWSWNGKLTPEETRWQVREMSAKGFGGGFIHARFGLVTEYLGEEWFANVAASIEEGKKTGFSSWLYDEDCWPSGSCSGKTASADPDFRARTLVCRRGNGPLQPVPIYYWGTPDPNLELLARFRMVERPDQAPEFTECQSDHGDSPDCVSFYACMFTPTGPGLDHYPDLLNDAAVREFINNSYEPYAQRFQRDFGGAVPGIFTDEPLLLGGLPWSVRLAAEFRKRRGYDLISKLPHLIFATAESYAVRHDYWQTVAELFSEGFMGQIARWCEQHNLALTGHIMIEGHLGQQVRCVGSCMPLYAQMGVPGIDVLMECIDELLTCKQVSSVANQFGKQRVLSELYGCTGYNFSFEGQRWVGDWQMALGVNLLCQHLSLYTMKGQAKRDYPPSYSYQTPWWRHYRHMADYQARLAYALRQGRPVRDILLLHPITSGWTQLDALASDYGVGALDSSLKALMQSLLDLHRDYDLGDETLMASHGKVEGTDLVLGEARYKVVLVPGMPNIESSTLDLLERFREAGGKLVFMREFPHLVDGRPSDRARQLAMTEGVTRIGAHKKQVDETLNVLLPRRVSVTDRDGRREAAGVLLMERRDGDSTIAFMVNTHRERSTAVLLRLEGQGRWEQWNCETGCVTPVPSSQRGQTSEVEWVLPPAGSALLVRKSGQPTPSVAPRTTQTEESLTPRGGWDFRRLAPNSLILDKCRWAIDDGPFSDTMFVLTARAQWYRRIGGDSKNFCNSAYQPWKLMLDPENVRTRGTLALRCPFRVDVLPRNEVFLVLEDPAETDIYVNGAKVDAPADGWFMDKSFEKVPVGRFLKTGENVVEVRMPVNLVREVEEMYLIGDFGVDMKSHAIIEEPRTLATGDWCPQGYPFYTDGIVYEASVRLDAAPAGQVRIEFGDFAGTVAAIWVNGKKAAVIGWRPYRAEITQFLKAGENKIGVEIVGSPRNLMGPRHSAERYPPWFGPNQFADMSEPTYHMTAAGLTGEVRLIWLRPVRASMTEGADNSLRQSPQKVERPAPSARGAE